jgi:hypothetical protein
MLSLYSSIACCCSWPVNTVVTFADVLLPCSVCVVELLDNVIEHKDQKFRIDRATFSELDRMVPALQQSDSDNNVLDVNATVTRWNTRTHKLSALLVGAVNVESTDGVAALPDYCALLEQLRQQVAMHRKHASNARHLNAQLVESVDTLRQSIIQLEQQLEQRRSDSEQSFAKLVPPTPAAARTVPTLLVTSDSGNSISRDTATMVNQRIVAANSAAAQVPPPRMDSISHCVGERGRERECECVCVRLTLTTMHSEFDSPFLGRITQSVKRAADPSGIDKVFSLGMLISIL